VTTEQSFLLQRVQPAMIGLIDGSLSTLAPIFGIAFYTHKPHAAFVAGLATAIGAGISMAFSEGRRTPASSPAAAARPFAARSPASGRSSAAFSTRCPS